MRGGKRGEEGGGEGGYWGINERRSPVREREDSRVLRLSLEDTVDG